MYFTPNIPSESNLVTKKLAWLANDLIINLDFNRII